MDIRDVLSGVAEQYPQWTGLISSLDVRDYTGSRPADNDGRTLFFNGAALAEMPEDSRKFYIARELVHMQLSHFSRGKDRDRGLWRKASDNVTGCMLKEDGFTIPDDVYLQTEAAGKSAEEMYGIYLARGETPDNAPDSGEPVVTPNEKKKKEAGKETGAKLREIDDVSLAATIAGLAELLEPSMQLDYDWFPGTAIRDGMLRDEFRAYPVSHAEILLDTSASVDAGLLRYFVRGVKGLLKKDAVVRVGCFDTRFYSFHDINTEDDINKLELHGSGGTDFSVAVSAFTGDAENRIILTDGYAEMPEQRVDAIWVVYGTNTIHPKGGRVLYVRPAEEKEKHEIDFLIT